MLYVALFDFIDGDRNGFLTTIVDAKNPKDAFKKCTSLIMQLQATNDREVFKDVTEVMLESIVEVNQLPPEGLLTHYLSLDGEPGSSISTNLIGAPKGSAKVFDSVGKDGVVGNILKFGVEKNILKFHRKTTFQ